MPGSGSEAIIEAVVAVVFILIVVSVIAAAILILGQVKRRKMNLQVRDYM